MELLNTEDFYTIANIIHNKKTDNNFYRVLSEMTKEQINTIHNVNLINEIIRLNKSQFENVEIVKENIHYQDPHYIKNPFSVKEKMNFLDYLIFNTYLTADNIKKLYLDNGLSLKTIGKYDIDEPLIVFSQVNLEKLEKAKIFDVKVFDTISSISLEYIIDQQIRHLWSSENKTSEKKVFIEQLILLLDTNYSADSLYLKARDFFDPSEMNLIENAMQGKVDYVRCQETVLNTFFYISVMSLEERDDKGVMYAENLINDALKIYDKRLSTSEINNIAIKNFSIARSKSVEPSSIPLFNMITSDKERKMLSEQLNDNIVIKKDKVKRI